MTMIHNPETPSKFHLSLLMSYLAACVGKLFDKSQNFTNVAGLDTIV